MAYFKNQKKKILKRENLLSIHNCRREVDNMSIILRHSDGAVRISLQKGLFKSFGETETRNLST